MLKLSNRALACCLLAGAAASASVRAAAPVAGDDSYQVTQNQTLMMGAPGVLANDYDADGDPLTAVVSANPTYGTLTLEANGAFTYAPNAGFYGSDSFGYEASDGTATSAVAIVSLTITQTTPSPGYGSGGGGGYGGGTPSPAMLLLFAVAALYPRGLKLAKRRAISP